MNLIERFVEKQISRYGVIKIITSAILALVLLALLTYWVKDSLCSFFNAFEFCSLLGGELKVVSGIAVSIVYVLLILLIASILNFLWQWIYPKGKEITLLPDISKWIYQGHLKICSDLEITSSHAGVLMNNLYKNFEMDFHLKILNGGGAGIIFRAQDLENYLMLKISLGKNSKTEKTEIYITPAIRFLGNFESFNLPNVYEEQYYTTNLEFTSGGMVISLKVLDRIAELQLTSKKKTETFIWNIPTHTEANILKEYNHKQNMPWDGRFVNKIWFREKYGKIGFRAPYLQKAIISDLRIKELRQKS